MTKSNVFYVFCVLSAVFFISGCVSGGGYSSKKWDYSQPTPAAQSAPKSLADLAAEKEAQAQNEVEAEGLSAPTISPQDTMKSVKVALLLPLSGKHAALGEAMLNAAQIALFDVGHNSFELLPYDTQGTADGGRAAARAVIQEGAELVLGPVFADAVRGAKPVTSSARVNMVAFSTDWQLAGGNTYIMGFLPFDQVDRVVSYAAQQGVRSVGVITPSTEYGKIVTSAYQSAAARYGIQTPAVERFPINAPNLAPNVRAFAKYDQRQQQTAAAQAANAGAIQAPAAAPFDAVLMPVGGQTAISIANLLNQYDLPPREVRRLGTGLLDDGSLTGEPGLEGAWFAAPSPTLRQNFESRYRTTYSHAPPRLASLAYDATALAAVLAQRGLKATGSPAFDANSIRNPNGFAGIDGIFRFRNNGTAERGLAVLEYRNGRAAVVDESPKTFQKAPQY